MALQIDGGGLQGLPTILKDWISWMPAEAAQWSTGSDTDPARQIYAGRDAGYGFTGVGGMQDFLASPFFRNTDNYEWAFDPKTGAPTVRVKTADKTGTYVTYKQDAAGNWVPDYGTQNAQQWETNNNDDFYKGVGSVLGAAVLGNAAAGSGLLGGAAQGAWQGGMTGGTAAGLGGAAAANPYALTAADFAASSAPATAWGTTGAGYIPGSYAASPFAGAVAGEGGAATLGELATAAGGMAPAAATVPSGGTGSGIKFPTTAGEWGDWLSKGGTAINAATGGSGTGGGTSNGGLLGAGIGGLLGYLDAKNQPDSLTIKNEIDPRLAQYAYGPNGTTGIAGAASNLMNQQLTGPNPMVDAGKRITEMAGMTPDWATLVSQNKDLWATNPYVEGILKKTQEGITSQMGKAGFGSGSFGNSGVASQTADALANAENTLRYNAFNDWQNRAMQGAQSAGQYGLQNQFQTAGLLGKGAEYQQQGSWDPIKNATGVMGALPGNTSRTEPLFNNPWASAIGGASLGGQVAGGINWGDLFKGIGGIGDWLKTWGGGSSTPPLPPR